MNPGKYYLRYIEDTNGNGKWDTGNYENRRQPEKVYYYPQMLDFPRKNMDLESEWNIKEIPIDKQKPLDITKNKPAQKKPKRSEQTGGNQQRNNTNQSGSNRMNMPASGGNSPRIM
jgi:hypothetical protein